jgi:hypothetical protein
LLLFLFPSMSSFKFLLTVWCLVALVSTAFCYTSDDLEVTWNLDGNQMYLSNASITDQFWMLR